MKILVAGEATNNIFENVEEESKSLDNGSNVDSYYVYGCFHHYD